MVLAHGTGKNHPRDIRRQDRLAVRPSGKRAEAEQKQQQVFRLELGRPVAISAEQPGRHPRERDEDDDRNGGKDESLERERREDKAKCQNRPEIVDEASRQNDFPVLGFVEAVFQHHGINHRH